MNPLDALTGTKLFPLEDRTLENIIQPYLSIVRLVKHFGCSISSRIQLLIA
jgi:hypothetical protein